MKTIPMNYRYAGCLCLCLALWLLSIPAQAGWGHADLRRDVRFLTDRMAYELRLSPQQYDDVYEVNYDFLAHVAPLREEVMFGHRRALERYYDCLDIRNDDLRWILSRSQYRRFLKAEHFYRPYCSHQSRWQLRIYLVYHDIHHFHYGKPYHYLSYCGGHYRNHYAGQSYYRLHRHPHYRHTVYDGRFRIRQDRSTYDRHSRRDFLVGVRPNPRPEARPNRPGRPETRPSRPNRPDARPEHPNRVERPAKPVRPDGRPVQHPALLPIRPEARPNRGETQPVRPQAHPQRPERPSRPARPETRPSRPNRVERRKDIRREDRKENRRVNRSDSRKDVRRENRQQRSNERQQRRTERELYRTV